MRLLRGLLWACAKGPWGVPRLVLGSGLLSFFGSVDVLALCIKNVGPVLQLWKKANLPHSSGLSCSFIWGLPPWAWCPDPKEAPAFLATACAPLSCLLALLSAPPSAGTAAHEGTGLPEIKGGLRDLSQTPPLACGDRKDWRKLS